jgi:N-methylhydantoinase A
VEGLRLLVERYGDEHDREFGYRLPREFGEVEIVNIRTALIGKTPTQVDPAYSPAEQPALPRMADVYFFEERGRIPTAYIARDSLRAGDTIEGPAIVTEWDSTTVVPPRAIAVAEETGDLVITFRR